MGCNKGNNFITVNLTSSSPLLELKPVIRGEHVIDLNPQNARIFLQFLGIFISLPSEPYYGIKNTEILPKPRYESLAVVMMLHWLFVHFL